MYLQDITPELLNSLTKQIKRVEEWERDKKCDYWKIAWDISGCSEHKGVYIDVYRCFLSYRCSKHRGNFKKLNEKEVFYLKCHQN